MNKTDKKACSYEVCVPWIVLLNTSVIKGSVPGRTESNELLQEKGKNALLFPILYKVCINTEFILLQFGQLTNKTNTRLKEMSKIRQSQSHTNHHSSPLVYHRTSLSQEFITTSWHSTGLKVEFTLVLWPRKPQGKNLKWFQLSCTSQTTHISEKDLNL